MAAASDESAMMAWTTFANCHRSLCPDGPELGKAGPQRGRALHLGTLDALPLPVGAVTTGAALCVGVRISFYDEARMIFIGRTWVSPCVPAKLTTAQGRTTALDLALEVYYHTSIHDPSCFGVLELVGEVRRGGQLLRSRGLGWCPLPLCAKEEDDAIRVTALFAGSPRVLLTLKGPLAQELPLEAHRLPGATLSYTLSAHPAVLDIRHLLPAQHLVSKHDMLPGCLTPLTPQLQPVPPRICCIDGLELQVDVSLADFENNLLDHLHANYAEDIQAPSVELDTGRATIRITERRLRLGVHNGLGYVRPPQVAHLVPNAQDATILKFDGLLELHSVAVDVNFALVFQMEYTVTLPVYLPDTDSKKDKRSSWLHSPAGHPERSETVVLRWFPILLFPKGHPGPAGASHCVTMLPGPTTSPDGSFIFGNSPLATPLATTDTSTGVSKSATLVRLRFNLAMEDQQALDSEATTLLQRAGSTPRRMRVDGSLSTSQRASAGEDAAGGYAHALHGVVPGAASSSDGQSADRLRHQVGDDDDDRVQVGNGPIHSLPKALFVVVHYYIFDRRQS